MFKGSHHMIITGGTFIQNEGTNLDQHPKLFVLLVSFTINYVIMNFHISDMSSDQDIAPSVCHDNRFICLSRSEETQPHTKSASISL